jgi:hypothetical protein
VLTYRQTPRATGVSFEKGGWWATYTRRGKKRILGPYRTADESSKERKIAIDEDPVVRAIMLTSRFLGVDQFRGRWRARLNHKHLGVYDDETVAAKAHDTASRDMYGTQAAVNFGIDGIETTPEQSSTRRAPPQRSNAARDHLEYEEIEAMNAKLDFRMCTEAEHDAIVAQATAELAPQNTARTACVITDEFMFTKDVTRLSVEKLPFVAMKAVLVGQDWTTDAMLACYDCSMYHADLKGLLLSPRAFEKPNTDPTTQPPPPTRPNSHHGASLFQAQATSSTRGRTRT